MRNALPLTLACLFSAPVIHAAVVVTPYSNNYSSSASDFTSGGTWAVAGGVYSNTIGASTTAATSSVSAPSLAGQSFQMSTTFSITAKTGDTATIGFGALGNTAGFSTASTGDSFVLADVSTDGSMRILGLRNSTGNLNIVPSTTTGNVALTTGVSYTLSLVGIYQSGGSILMTLTLGDGSTSRSVNGTLSATDAAFYAGSNFGYRDRTNASTITIGFDNFNLGQVPEPSSFALAAMGSMLAFSRRRSS